MAESIPDSFRLPVRYIRADELAERLHVSRQTVYRRARAGKLPCVCIGVTVRFDPDAVDEYLRSRQTSKRGVRS